MFNGARPETRIMYNNSLLNSTLRYSTPNKASFYASNILTSSRTSLYIPKDLFVIDGLNKTHHFKIGASPEVTVWLTEGTYTGTELAAHMQSVFGNGWVITYNETTKFFGFKNTVDPFELWTTGLFVEAAETIGIISGAITGLNFTGFRDNQYYAEKPRRHSYIKLNYDLGGSADCGFFALLGERNKTNSLSPSASVELRLSNSDDENTATLVSVTPTVNGAFTFLDAIIATPTFRYVWLKIVDKENVGENIVFSQLYLGGFIYWNERTIDHGFVLQYLDRSVRTESVSGALFFEKYAKYAYLSNLKLSYLTKAQVTLLQQVWFDLGKSEHFYLSLDSGWMNGDLSEYLFYGVFDEDPTIEEVGPRYFTASFTFRGD